MKKTDKRVNKILEGILFYFMLQKMENNQITTIVLDKTEVVLSLWTRSILLTVYILWSFTLPFLIGHPQLLVGILINTFLVLWALHMKKYATLPLIILPSLAVLARGIIFGPFTIFLVYMIPIIWLGNFLLVWGIKYFYLTKSRNKFFAVGISALGKFLLLCSIAWILVSLHILPKIFLTTMGLIQLGTAITGWILAIGLNYGIGKLKI